MNNMDFWVNLMLSSIILLFLILLIIILSILYGYFRTVRKPTPQLTEPEKKLNTRFFILDANVINPTNLLSRQLKVKLKLDNTDKIIENDNYIMPLNEDFIKENTNITCITMNKKQFATGIVDELDPNYYTIKNPYHLMDPFLTSGKDMIVTDEMKTEFQKIVDEKQQLKDTNYQTY